MTGELRRRITISVNALALGLFPAFFVADSVFADRQWAERRFLILAIVLGYGRLRFLAGWLSAPSGGMDTCRSPKHIAAPFDTGSGSLILSSRWHNAQIFVFVRATCVLDRSRSRHAL